MNRVDYIEQQLSWLVPGYVPWAPTPTPTPIPSTPYTELGGIPAGLDTFDGGDLSSLKGPARLRPDGKYTISGALGQSLYALEPGKLLVALAPKQQVSVKRGVVLAGFGVTGGGLAKSTNGKEAALVTDDDVVLCDFEATKSVGVGVLLRGKGLRTYRLHPHHCGTSGRMIFSRGDDKTKGSGLYEVASHIHDNNHGGLKSDAANKATQTSDYLGVDIVIEDEYDGGQWFDISCWNCVLQNPTIQRIRTSAEWFRGCGVRFELQIFGTYSSGVIGGYIGNVAGSALAVNESSNIFLDGTQLGPNKYSLELRQLTRNDDPGDGTLDPKNWYKPDNKPRTGPGRPGGAKRGWDTYAVRFAPKMLQGAGPLVLSDSGSDTKKIRRSTHKIIIENVDPGKIEIPA